MDKTEVVASLTAERDALLCGMREIVALKPEKEYDVESYGVAYNDGLNEAKIIAQRHLYHHQIILEEKREEADRCPE